MKRSPMPARSTPLASTTPIRKRRAGSRRVLAVRSGAWLDHVRAIECCVRCGAFGVQAAHRDEGKGGSIKTDDCLTAALCPECHAALGEGKQFTREDRRAEMNHWILATLVVLVRDDKVGPS